MISSLLGLWFRLGVFPLFGELSIFEIEKSATGDGETVLMSYTGEGDTDFVFVRFRFASIGEKL